MEQRGEPVISVCLLGPFHLTRCESEIAIPGAKMRALVSYLAMAMPEPLSRERMIGLLWSDRPDEQARQNLRHMLSTLRKSVGPDVLVTEGDDVSLAKGAVECDVTHFEALVQDGSFEALRAASALYRGPLLDGLSIHEDAFEAWLAQERRRLQDLAVSVLARVAEKQLEIGQAGEALNLARRAIQIDAYFEAAHRSVMQALAALGERGSALEHYRNLERLLDEELGVAPDEETKQLRYRIEAGDSAESPSPQAPIITGKPSIVVLPFTNTSLDSEQEYIADGITNDLIANLSRFRNMFVISRNSSFYYKGKPMKAQDVGRELGVRYILEGSIQKRRNKLNVNAELVEAATGHHIWSESFERDTEDLFAVQKEITRSIVSTIGSKALLKAEIDRILRAPTESSEAYYYYLRGELYYGRDTKDDNLIARQFFEKAIEIDPDFTLAVAAISTSYLAEIWGNWFVSRQVCLHKAEQFALRAIELDDKEPWGYQVLGTVRQFQGDIEHAKAMWEKAYALNPNDFLAINGLGYDLAYTGYPEKGLPLMEEAMHMNPHCNERQLRSLGQAYFLARRYQEAVHTLQRVTKRHRPSFWLYLAASYAQLNYMKDAKAAIAQALKLDPKLSLRHEISRRRTNGLAVENAIHLRNALTKAGLPE